VFIGLPPLPAAVICQHLRTQQPEVELLVYSWALTAQDFLSSGGSAIEGAAGLSRMPIVPDTPAHISYAQNYEERYKSRPTRADAMAYEAMQILLWAMQQTDDRKQYKSLILEKGTFDGLVGPLVLDAFGDIQRSYYITRVQNGQLVTEGEVRGANESQ
jgi:ABC-type branched-subunit amino acid transport system substrate-binding protein